MVLASHKVPLHRTPQKSAVWMAWRQALSKRQLQQNYFHTAKHRAGANHQECSLCPKTPMECYQPDQIAALCLSIRPLVTARLGDKGNASLVQTSASVSGLTSKITFRQFRFRGSLSTRGHLTLTNCSHKLIRGTTQ